MFLRIVAFFARLILRLFFRVEVHGSYRPTAKTLVVSNHLSFLDGILIGAFVPIQPTYLVHTTIARIWYFKIGLRFLPHLVVDTANPLAMKAIVHLIESGSPVVIFPEGRISVTGSLMKIYDGPAFVAARTGCSVVVIDLDGPEHSLASKMSGDFPKKFFPKIHITIHEPKTIPLSEARTAKLRRRAASESLRRIMQDAAFRSRRPLTIYEAFLNAADLHGHSRDIIEDVRQTPETYRHLIKASLALGRLVGKFTSRGEMVGVLMPNVSTTNSLLLGLFAFQRVPAMLNYTAGIDGMQSALRLTKAKVVVTSRAFVEKAKLGAVVEALRDVRVLYLEDLRPMFGLGDKLWLMGWALWFPRTVITPGKPGDPAVVLFTSGSEGKPKGVVLSHDNLLANCAQITSIIPITCKEKFMAALPLFHAFGLMGGLVLPLTIGARIFLYPSPLHYRIVPELIYDRDCTLMFATNTFLANYSKFAHPFDFYSLKYLVCGAEKMSEDVRALAMEKFGLRVIEGYGATECAPVISANTPFALKSGSVGQIAPGMEYRLAPVPGIEQGGALHVKGDNVMLGYLLNDQPGVIQPPQSEYGPGWYNTGDIVTFDENGFITIQGRLKRFAKVAGEMVSLEVVERIAVHARPNGQHASTSYRDAARGEVIVLYTQDATLKREHLLAAARELGAPELAVPRKVMYVEKLPVLGTGKKDYVTLGKLAAQSAKAMVESA